MFGGEATTDNELGLAHQGAVRTSSQRRGVGRGATCGRGDGCCGVVQGEGISRTGPMRRTGSSPVAEGLGWTPDAIPSS